MPSLRNLSIGLLILSCAGCRSFINAESKPIPAQTMLDARGGGRICLAGDRHLLLRPNPNNTLASWGFEMKDSAKGPMVEFVVSRETHLREGDVIERVRTLSILSRVADPKNIEITDSGPRVLRMKKLGSVVSTKRELLSYGGVWCLLELLVQRDGKAIVVTQEVGRPQEMPVRLYGFSENARSGVFLTRIDHWKKDWQPIHSKPGDLLVFYVGQNTLLGKAGVRPLDLLRPIDSRGDWASLLRGSRVLADGREVKYRDEDMVDIKRVVEGIDLKYKGVNDQVELRQFQFLAGTVDYQSNGLKSYVGLGPFDWLFHYNSEYWYDERTDQYGYIRRYSIGSVFQSISSRRGSADNSLLGIDLLVDSAKFNYYLDGVVD